MEPRDEKETSPSIASTEIVNHAGANLEDTEKGLLTKVEKEIERLKYYLEESDEITKEGDFIEIEVTDNRTTAIHDRLCNRIAQVQELKIERGIETARAIRQWKRIRKKDSLRGYYRWERSKTPSVRDKRKSKTKSTGRKPTKEMHDKEWEMWEEKFKAEFKMTEKKIKLERTAKASLAELPQLKITLFKGMVADCVRFENMFLTQSDSRPFSDEEKFGYLSSLSAQK